MPSTPSMRHIALSLSRPLIRRLHTTSPRSTAWSPGPSPPRLAKDEQEIFEQLQKQSTGAFSNPRVTPSINQLPQSGSPGHNQSEQGVSTIVAETSAPEMVVQAKVPKGEELHPNIRRGAPPEFEGERNPKTGEYNGPKVEPLRWGGGVDWSYNGRVTDF